MNNTPAIPRFDAHCDTITRFRPLRQNRLHIDLDRLSAFAPSAQIFALWAPPHAARPATFRLLMHRMEAELARNRDVVTLCKSAQDIRRVAGEGKIAALLSVEGAELLGCSVAGLVSAHRRGVRAVNLTWNSNNALCGAAVRSGGGLTQAGRRFVEAAWALGVAVDLSHASDAAFWDVLDCAARPVLCSHSNARALCDHPRNLSDEQIRAVIENGGCIGLNLCPDFIGRSLDMPAVLEHVEHILSLGGERTLCLGADLDGVEALPAGFTGVESMADLYVALLQRNYSEELVQDIFYRNLLRYMEKAL